MEKEEQSLLNSLKIHFIHSQDRCTRQPLSRDELATWCTQIYSVDTSVSITNERTVPLTSKLSSELTSFIDVANMTLSNIFSKIHFF